MLSVNKSKNNLMSKPCEYILNNYKSLEDYIVCGIVQIPVDIYNGSKSIIDEVYELLKMPEFENNKGELVHWSMSVRPVMYDDDMVDGVVIAPSVICVDSESYSMYERLNNGQRLNVTIKQGKLGCSDVQGSCEENGHVTLYKRKGNYCMYDIKTGENILCVNDYKYIEMIVESIVPM